MRRPLLIVLAVLISFVCLPGRAPAETVLDATTSWIGNTYGYGDGSWTQIDIRAIAVTPQGKVYTNAPWDESGAEASVYQDGKMLGFAGGTHGWGNAGGSAIAVNDRYAYVAIGVGNEKGRLVSPGIWPEKGRQWWGISRRAIGDMRQPAPFRAATAGDSRAKMAASFLKVNDVPTGTRDEVGGLAASMKRLYATDPNHDSVDVYDAETMDKLSSFSAPEPGRIALAADGTLWLLSKTLTGPAKLLHVRADGRPIDDAPALPADSEAVDVAVDAKSRVLVADNGPRQQILIYAKQGDKYVPATPLGERGGIFSGVAGRPGPCRFNGLTGVGADRDGNIYVSMNGIGPKQGTIGAGLGATLASYDGGGKLRWQVDGLLFVDGASIDPARPNSVYTGNKRFELDFSKPAGHEWKYAGFLSNRFKYPDDPVFNTDQWPGLPTARRLDGHTFLYLTDMYADHLKIYRFDAKRDGETAIPSGLFAGRARGVDKIPNRPPGGDWIWRDLNGNGPFRGRRIHAEHQRQSQARRLGLVGRYQRRHLARQRQARHLPLPLRRPRQGRQPDLLLRQAHRLPGARALHRAAPRDLRSGRRHALRDRLHRRCAAQARHQQGGGARAGALRQVVERHARQALPGRTALGARCQADPEPDQPDRGRPLPVRRRAGRHRARLRQGHRPRARRDQAGAGSGARLGLGRRAVRDQRASPRQRRVPGLRGGGRARQGDDVSVDAAMREAHEAMMAIEQVERNGRDLPGRRHG